MKILSILQIVVPFFLIIFILIQQKGTALGSVFGGSGDFYASRRGAEQKIFWITIILGVLFIAVSLLNLFIQ